MVKCAKEELAFLETPYKILPGLPGTQQIAVGLG